MQKNNSTYKILLAGRFSSWGIFGEAQIFPISKWDIISEVRQRRKESAISHSHIHLLIVKVTFAQCTLLRISAENTSHLLLYLTSPQCLD